MEYMKRKEIFLF